MQYLSYHAAVLRTTAAVFTIGTTPLLGGHLSAESPRVELPADEASLDHEWNVAAPIPGWEAEAASLPALDETHNRAIYNALAASQELVSGPVLIA